MMIKFTIVQVQRDGEEETNCSPKTRATTLNPPAPASNLSPKDWGILPFWAAALTDNQVIAPLYKEFHL